MASVQPQVDTESLLERLQSGATQLGLTLSDAQSQQLLSYLGLLKRWNAVHSLSAWARPSDMVIHHLMDSMTLVSPLDRFAGSKALRVLDAGSGAGFPAAVLAVMRPGWNVTAADAVAKKAAFVRHAAAEARIGNLAAWHGRLEDLRPAIPFDLVVSRALGSLSDFVRWTDGALGPAGVWLAQKGQVPDHEMQVLDSGMEVFHVEQVTVPGLSAQRHLIWLRRCKR